jgi:hypothetical protein
MFRTLFLLALTGFGMLFLLTLWKGIGSDEIGALIPRGQAPAGDAAGGVIPYDILYRESLANRANLSLWVAVPRDASREDIDRLTGHLERTTGASRALSIYYHCDPRYASRHAQAEPGYATSLLASYERIGDARQPAIRLSLFLGCRSPPSLGLAGAAAYEDGTEGGPEAVPGLVGTPDDPQWGLEACREAFALLNSLREGQNRTVLAWDARLYELAVLRSRNMYERGYIDHLDLEGRAVIDMPEAAWVPDGVNLADSIATLASERRIKVLGHCRDAVQAWSRSRGHWYNMLYSRHEAGAVGCYKDVCLFLGMNRVPGGLGSGVYSENPGFWDDAPLQEGEVPLQ